MRQIARRVSIGTAPGLQRIDLGRRQGRRVRLNVGANERADIGRRLHPRSVARRITSSPSPGRRRMVIRSLAATCSHFSSGWRASHSASRSRRRRIARSASSLSESPACRAINLNRAFSSIEGRTVIEGPHGRALRALRACLCTARKPTASARSSGNRSFTDAPRKCAWGRL